MLLERIAGSLPGKKSRIDVLIPYADAGAAAKLHDGEVIFSESYEPDGIRLSLLADSILLSKLKNYIV